MPHPDPTWWPVTVTWDTDEIRDEIFATTRKEAKDAAEECWPGATITVNPA